MAGGEREDALVQAALEKSSDAARLLFLEGACLGDPDLLQRVHQRLGLRTARCEPQVGPDSAMPSTADAPARIGPGGNIGPYRLLQEIGEGGMGTVFLAEQKRPVSRRVAVKLMKAGIGSQQAIARFDAEKQALALMDHPNIAKVFDAGTTESGRPYFVMELVKGIPITQYCDQERLSPVDRLKLFIPVCHAVQHAHQKGVIHRDLKPSNVIVGHYDGRPVPKVIDFGVAKAISGKLTDQTMATELGQIVGTLEYMAPEQIVSNNLDIDTRADIYSLGATLYELLVGVTPLSGRTLRDAPLAELLRTVRDVEPLTPSQQLLHALPDLAANRGVEPARLVRLINGELDWIVMKCLEKERVRRYETANGLATDIECYLNDEPVIAGPPSRIYRLSKFVRRNLWPILAIVTIVVALFAGLCGTTILAYLWGNEVGEKKLVIADLNRRVYEGESILAFQAWNDGNLDRLANLLPSMDSNLRGIEWQVLKWQYDAIKDTPKIATIESVFGLAYSSDGKFLAFAGRNARLYHRASSQIHALSPNNGCSHVTFSPLGEHLIGSNSSSSASAVYVWRLPEKALLAETSARFTGLASVTISPDGRFAAGVRPNKAIEARQFPGGELVWSRDHQEVREDENRYVVTFSADGRFLAVGSRDERLCVWRAEDGKLLADRDTNHWIEGLVFSPDNATLVAIGERGVTLWSVSTEAVTQREQLNIPAVSGAFSPDGTLLALGCSDHCVRLVDTKDLSPIARLLHSAYPLAVAFSPDGKEIAGGGRNGEIFQWSSDLWDNNEVRRGMEHWQLPLAVSGQGAVATCEDSETGFRLKLWDTVGNRETFLTDVTSTSVLPFPPAIAVSPDGRTVAIGCNDGFIRLWSLDQERVVREYQVHGTRINSLSYSSDGELLASGGREPGVTVMNVKSGVPLALPLGFDNDIEVISVAFSSKGLLAAAGGVWDRHGETKIWKREGSTLSPQHSLMHPDIARWVAFSPDGNRLIVTEDFDAALFHVMDTATWKTICTIKGHAAKSMVGVFSYDGRRIITGSDDFTIRFWDAHTGVPLGTLETGERTRAIVVLPGDRGLVSASREGTVRIWKSANQ